MECKSAEYRISLYLDGALDKATEELLFKHIETCESCSAYLEQAMELHNLTKGLLEEEDLIDLPSSASIMEAIHNENVAFKKRQPRILSLAAAAVLALIVMFVPINSKTVLAHVNDFVRRLIVNQPGLVMIVEDRSIARSYDHTGGKIIPTKVSDKYLRSQEEVIEPVYNKEQKPCLPVYMVDGYKFNYAFYGKHKDATGNDFYIESYYIKQNDPSSQKDSIAVNLLYKKPGISTSGAKWFISENEQAKEIATDNEKGIIIMRNEDTDRKTYEAHFILTKQGAELKITCKSKEEAGKVEADILKIAEPLLQQIKKEVPENK